MATASDRQSLQKACCNVITGDAATVLRTIPTASIDMCMTSPPYWKHRNYDVPGIGQEGTPQEYVEAISTLMREVHRVLKPEGSLWLNLGDTYEKKCLMGMPWRLALALIDQQGWLLRNDIVWDKVKGAPDNSKDKLRNIHEYLFHFVKQKTYYYDVDAIRSKPSRTKVVNGAVVSATGVSGIRYKRQIQLSTALSLEEKRGALEALESVLADLKIGRISDFRMIIRGQQRTTHSDNERVSGRAKELVRKGYYFLKYNPKGAKPSDVWSIIPEDTQGRQPHFAAYPEDLCRVPILATTPQGGTVLDPFCGTGTTLRVAIKLNRSAIGIDISADYVRMAEERLGHLHG